ncbi:hypothetical protein PYW07_007428 [Mythimna separata]|uniref:Reverse transcriptase domain-containing protein n=1 Tax=Mythimna separata TaxID=271217 RepID=A0AAD8E147_MYTSE|nr:hypothetical protein PYW07_007428 [Mythimna separata]
MSIYEVTSTITKSIFKNYQCLIKNCQQQASKQIFCTGPRQGTLRHCSQAYFHIPIKKTHRRYLAFVYAGELWQMTVLPLGLSSAPLAFSRISKWLASFLRERGIRVLVYLDDFLFANQNPYVLESQMKYAVNLLQNFGWCVNLQKSVLNPRKQIEFIGIVWNTELNQKRLPHEKVVWLQADLDLLLRTRRCSWRTGTALVG